MKQTIRSSAHNWLFTASRLPAILEADEAAALLGLPYPTICLLIAAKHLRPLGKPGKKSAKKFSTCYLEGLAENPIWQHTAIRIIGTHWINKNAKSFKLSSPRPTESMEDLDC